jgi:hypothetical protein
MVVNARAILPAFVYISWYRNVKPERKIVKDKSADFHVFQKNKQIVEFNY